MKGLQALLLQILIELIQKMTPELRQLLCGMLHELERKAKTTPNPVDDLICMLLLGLMACDEGEQK